MKKSNYELTADYQKSLQIIKNFTNEILGGDIENLRNFCFEDLDSYIGNINDPDMYLITQAIYIVLWGDIYNLTFENMGQWNWQNQFPYRGDTMNSFGSIFGKENKELNKEFAFRAKYYGADKNLQLWEKIKKFYKMYHCIGNFIVLPNRGNVKNGINGARAGYYNSVECEGMRDYFDWFLVALYEYQEKVKKGDNQLSKFEMQLQMNSGYNPEFMEIQDWNEKFYLKPYFKDGIPQVLFKTPLKERLKITDPNGTDPKKSYFREREYLELMEDYIDKASVVIEYRTDKIIEVLKVKCQL